jgi:RNA polymerase sigma-70 factor (ECF subfamily)
MSYPDQMDHSSIVSEREKLVAALVEDARNGDRAAFERIIGLFHEDVFRMIYYRTRSRMDAEDIEQDVFLQAYKSLSSLKDVGKFRSWLFTIAVNRVRDFLRKRRLLAFFGISASEEESESPELQVDREPNALDQLMRQEFWSEVQRLSNRFSSAEREVFFLRFVDELSIREIAEVLKKSESAVKTHLYRALKKFKDDSLFFQPKEGEIE